MSCLRVLIDVSANAALAEVMTPPYFQIVHAPEEADAIIFGHDYTDLVRASRNFQKWRKKCLVFTENDLPSFILPAIYASNRKHLFGKGRALTYSFFLAQRVHPNPYLEDARLAARPKKYLLAFVGGSTCWLRKRFLLAAEKIKDPDVLIRSTDTYNHWDWAPERAESRRSLREEYAVILSQSSFFLCPRGAGASSVRLFETMEMGVCPIILSDDYIFPEGPAWKEFALIVPERNINQVVAIARAHAHEAEARGRRAREEFLKYFGPDVQAETLARMITQLLRERSEFRERLIQIILPLIDLLKKMRGGLRALIKRAVLNSFHRLGLKMPYQLNRPLEEQIGVKTRS